METELYRRLAAIVVKRGLVIGNVGRYTFVETWDNGTRWDITTQGPTPTQTEIDNVSAADLQALKAHLSQKDRIRDLADPRFKALARAIHVRFGRPDAATMTTNTWRNILEAAWDAENS